MWQIEISTQYRCTKWDRMQSLTKKHTDKCHK
jgi:hypothetical protein